MLDTSWSPLWYGEETELLISYSPHLWDVWAAWWHAVFLAQFLHYGCVQKKTGSTKSLCFADTTSFVCAFLIWDWASHPICKMCFLELFNFGLYPHLFFFFFPGGVPSFNWAQKSPCVRVSLCEQSASFSKRRLYVATGSGKLFLTAINVKRFYLSLGKIFENSCCLHLKEKSIDKPSIKMHKHGKLK